MIRLDDSVVICPRCGGNYTHHGRVEVYQRRTEDAGDGLRVTVNGQTLAVNTEAGKGNPSGRRNGIRVVLSCETCPGEFEIIVYQHKGQTFVDAGY